MAAKAKKTEETKDITVSLNIKTIKIPIEGVSPLIVSRFDPKSIRQMVESGEAEKGLKQGGKKKNIADPKEDYENSIYYFADGKTYGFPCGAFKTAMVTAGYRGYGLVQTVLRSSFHIMADGYDTDGHSLVKLEGEPRPRMDMVRVGGMNKVASPRYRAEFPVWRTTLTIQFLEDVISEEKLVGLANAAGFTCGVGEWRPEKSASGSFGMFRVSN